jgi:death-on-curing family protein
MPKKYIYPTRDAIENVNKSVNLMSNRRADTFKMLRPVHFLDKIIEEVNKAKGNVYDKAAVLLRRLIVAHGFASGNKRTAIIVTAFFIEENGGKTKFKDIDRVEKVLRNIRLYNEKEIAKWLRMSEIDETKLKG